MPQPNTDMANWLMNNLDTTIPLVHISAVMDKVLEYQRLNAPSEDAGYARELTRLCTFLARKTQTPTACDDPRGAVDWAIRVIELLDSRVMRRTLPDGTIEYLIALPLELNQEDTNASAA